jgi:3'-phosphoadenosine 5'-phosphosulfate sulfotransferase (PAPS reductase)/FAD synthetase
MEHILSLSYGKDSLACLGAIEQLGLPLDRIIHAEVWATDTIPADLPPMVEFKKKADAIIEKRWGIKVEHISTKTYEHFFYKTISDRAIKMRVALIKKFEDAGKKHNYDIFIYGFPCVKGAWCNSKLKVAALKSAQPKGSISYIGIAADEPNRIHRLSDAKRSPLVEAGWTEEMCRQWCVENDLLSPIYTTATRGGCWFCHNQGVQQLRLLRKEYPEYWKLMLKWDTDSPVTFHPDGHTVHDFDRRFQLEDDGLIPIDARFNWAWLDNPPGTQMRLF